MNTQTTPIVIPMIIPITIPRPREETEFSDEIFENFATRVIGSVVEFPPNNVECVKRV